MILLVDNYDSFTWNLWHQLAAAAGEVVVRRNDEVTVDEVLAMAPRAVVFSPGPGRPAEAGICPELLAALPAEMPFLGVCLGHQALVEHCGGVLERDPAPMHGKASEVLHEGAGLFRGLPSPLVVGRYHSLRARADALPQALRLDAWTADGQVMAVAHRERPWFGIQFHPESVLTPDGGRLIAGFLGWGG